MHQNESYHGNSTYKIDSDQNSFSWLKVEDSSECPGAFEDMKSYIDLWGDILYDIKQVKKIRIG